MTVPDAGKRQGAGLAFAYVTTLFFAWGFATSLIDPLIAAVKRVFGEHAQRVKMSSIKSMIGHAIGAAGAMARKAGSVAAKMGASRPPRALPPKARQISNRAISTSATAKGSR